MTSFPEQDLRTGLRLKREPLTGVEETEHEWWIGTLSIGKVHAVWRSGHAHPLRPDAHFYKQWFDFDDRRGWAVIFRPQDPPAPKVGDYFIGWADPSREADVDRWLAFLNNEIAVRTMSTDPGQDRQHK